MFASVAGAVPSPGPCEEVLNHSRQGEDRVWGREHPHPPLTGHGREAVGGDLGAHSRWGGTDLQHQKIPSAAARCVETDFRPRKIVCMGVIAGLFKVWNEDVVYVMGA